MFTAIFIGCMTIGAVVMTLLTPQPKTGTGLGESVLAGAGIPYPTEPVVTTPPEVNNDKANLSPNGESIIGLRSPTLIKSPATLTTTTFDTTTYGDRAVVKLTNSTGSSVSMTGLAIRGKIVSQLAGKNGYVWEYSDYDAIEKEGENYYEVSNDFIFTPSQAKSIGDFVWKELKPHKLYSLMLVGMHYNYEIGDVFHLTLTHVMNGGTMEDIDTDVEVMGTSMSRSVGGVGTTNLNLRVPSSAWALTLARNARLVGAGNSQRLNNRSNVVTVASSTWTGQADYFCDGTDDDVEIQAAIDYLYSIGGGALYLTSGWYNFNTGYITAKSNVSVFGEFPSTTFNIADGGRFIYNPSGGIIGFGVFDVNVTGNTYTPIEMLSADNTIVLQGINITVGNTNNNAIYIRSLDSALKDINIVSNSKTSAQRAIRITGTYGSGGTSTINRCFINGYYYGIDTSQSQSILIDSCSIINCSGYAIFLYQNMRVTGSYIYNCGNGIYIWKEGTITNNTIDLSSYGAYGISGGVPGSFVATDCIITGNRILNTVTSKIYNCAGQIANNV